MLKFVHNIGANGGFMRTKFRCARARDRNFTGQKSAKNGQVSTVISWYVSILMKQKFVVFEHTYQPPFFKLC